MTHGRLGLGLAAVAVVCGGAFALPLRSTDAASVYSQKILVANRAGLAPAPLIDPQLINPWGIALRPPGAGGHIWISNAGNLSTSTFVGDVGGVPLHQNG